MNIIETIDDYNEFLSAIQDKEIIILPTLVNPNKHYCDNELSLIYVMVIDRSVHNIGIIQPIDEYVIGFNHTDLVDMDVSILEEMQPEMIWTINQKQLLKFIKNKDIKDIDMFYYLSSGNLPQWNLDTQTHLYFNRKYSQEENINCYIPLPKHIELHQNNVGEIISIISYHPVPGGFNFYTTGLQTMYEIESQGIRVDLSNLQKYYGDKIIPYVSSDNRVFSEYNFYTSAGRPSNRYGGLNFAAIDKEKGHRTSFIPKNDAFLLFDFDSYHLNLIAKLIGYEFGEKNIHTYLGRYYFGKEELTDEEYEDSKEMNFKLLYGGVPKDIKEAIPFFSKVQDFYFDIWRQIKKNEYYESPLSQRRIQLKNIDDPSPTKVFNYFIQLMETEANLVLMERINKFLKDYKTNLILYIYDSFLFDISQDDGKEMINGLRDILKVFPTKVYFGYDYQNLKEITETFNAK
jgi:hypothetical protein